MVSNIETSRSSTMNHMWIEKKLKSIQLWLKFIANAICDQYYIGDVQPLQNGKKIKMINKYTYA